MADDRAILGRLLRELEAGSCTCRFCGCHGESCRLDDGDKCCWIDRFRTVCSSKPCTIRYYAEKRTQQRVFGRRKRRAA